MAGMEVIFFTGACTVLCFGFVAKTALVTRQCFGYCSADLQSTNTFSSSLTLLLSRTPGWARSWKGTQPGQVAQAEHRDVTHHMISSKRNWGKGVLEQVAIAWGPAGHQSPCDRWWVTAFASLFSSLCKTILISTHEFSHFCSPHFPSHPAGRGRELRGGWAAAVWCLAAGRDEPTTTNNTLNLF